MSKKLEGRAGENFIKSRLLGKHFGKWFDDKTEKNFIPRPVYNLVKSIKAEGKDLIRILYNVTCTNDTQYSEFHTYKTTKERNRTLKTFLKQLNKEE